MRHTAKYDTAINLLFLAIIAVAYTGKAFHSHSDEYYADYERTECTADGQSSISDDCHICHFQFFTFLYTVAPLLAFATTLLVRYIGTPMPKCIEESHPHYSRRAPPIES